jgi:glycosyltransferase involved in cell wall biosynthesis
MSQNTSPNRIAWLQSLNQCADRRDNPVPVGGVVSRYQTPNQRIVIRCHLYAHGGYGQLAERLGMELEARGIPVAYDPISVVEEFAPVQPFIRDRLVSLPVDRWELLLSVPSTPLRETKKSIFFTMWESTHMADHAVGVFNQSESVIVPCTFNRHCFQQQGVTKPIYVVPLGIDPTEWQYLGPPPVDGPTIFATAARHSHGGIRKNTVDMARAFCEAFPKGDEPVEFRIKCFTDCATYLSRLPRDRRIKIYDHTMSTEELVDWCRQATVGAFCSRGEGWGLHIHQFMALGRPPITCLGTAMADYYAPGTCVPVDYDWDTARDTYEAKGDWMVPVYEDMVNKFQFSHRNRELIAEMAPKSAEQARRFSWSNTGDKLIAALEATGILKDLNLKPGKASV